MTPARWPRPNPLAERLLWIDRAAGALADARVGDLPRLLEPGDLLVVNDSATLPASLPGRAGDAEIEVRLAGERADGSFRAVLFGAGDWRTPTEHRPPPPALPVGAQLALGADGALHAIVERIDPLSPRLVELRFDRGGAPLYAALFRVGRPVQYAYLAGPLALWHVQTLYAARPWSAEQPSAGRPLTAALYGALRAHGVAFAQLTHAAGLSSTGDPAIDAALPLPERYEIPAATVTAIATTRAAGRRVLAVGTSAARALEGCFADHGALRPGAGETALRLGPATPLHVVDGLLTGLHDPATSHFELLEAFAPRPLLEHAWSHAEAEGYLCHEFGDSCLLV